MSGDKYKESIELRKLYFLLVKEKFTKSGNCVVYYAYIKITTNTCNFLSK